MEKRKRGGQPGNKNAIGNRGGGAPIGNTNAQKHGLYGRDGVLNRKSKATIQAEISEYLQQQRIFKYWVEKLYNGEITPDDFYSRYDMDGILEFEGDFAFKILKAKRSRP
jgi:hypothetical protein